jgi:hypothetical protein
MVRTSMEPNPYPDIGAGRLALMLAVAALLVVALLGTTRLLGAVADPTDACRDALPIAEGLSLVDAKSTWPPPLIRCRAIDLDPGQRGTGVAVTRIHDQAVVTVVALGVAAIVAAIVAVSALAWRRRTMGDDTNPPTSAPGRDHRCGRRLPVTVHAPRLSAIHMTPFRRRRSRRSPCPGPVRPRRRCSAVGVCAAWPSRG